jgi:hypothetical protein
METYIKVSNILRLLFREGRVSEMQIGADVNAKTSMNKRDKYSGASHQRE